MEVTIDKNSGYCFGVEFAIQMAEDELVNGERLYCLGDIVHNSMEVKRLNDKGLEVINKEQLNSLHDCKVLIRAHGEPPETYETALRNNIELIDASCPVVLKLQNRVKNAYDKIKTEHGQVVIYGQKGHAEVIGLAGQTNNEAIIVTDFDDLTQIDFSRPISFFSQTTKSTDGFYKMKSEIEERVKNYQTEKNPNPNLLDYNDSICRQVSNREPQLQKFAQEHDAIVFVSGKKSSNGKALFSVCKSVNANSYFVESEDEIEMSWFKDSQTIGICGATSTPLWLMERVQGFIEGNQVQAIA
jgi:4-hydroxy-3-methylbut-2-enyl diphosphate reductase